MSFLINTPPTLDGDNAAKILQLYKHLYKMSEEVNYALNALAEGNVVDLTGTTQARQTFATAMTGGSIGGTDAPSLQNYNELKSLIIKTGNAIEKSKASIELVLDDEVKRLEGNIGGFQNLIDAITGKVDGNTEAISGFNKQFESINQSISNTNQSVSDLSSEVNTKFDQTNTEFNKRIQEILNGDEGLLSKLETVNKLIDENKKAISDNDASIKKSLADEVAEILSSIDENNSSLEQKISDSATSLQGSIDETNESLNDLNTELSKANDAISGQNNKLDGIAGDLDDAKKAIALNDENVRKDFSDAMTSLQGTVDDQIEDVNDRIGQSETNLSNFQDQVGEDFETVNNTLSGQDDKIGGVEKGLSQAQTDISNNASDILDNKTEISGLKEINMELSNAFGVGSEYGSYAEAISNKMSLSAEGVVQKYELVSKLKAADAKAAEFAEWINVTDEYIKTGFLYTDENGTRRVGVAIGTNITTSIVDGVVQPNATKTDLLATFVSDSLIFWQGGQKVAYLSNKKLYILSAEFLGSYRIGKFQWVYTDDLGLVLEFLN